MHRLGVMPVRTQPNEPTLTMDLTDFKGKTLDDATLSKLSAAITSHTEALDARASTAEAKARTAAKESIEGRKGKDARIERMAELLGIEPDADLDKVDVKGQAEAAKQVEAQLKRITRERDEAVKASTEIGGKYAAERRERAIAEVVGKHAFIDAEDARALVSGRLRQEGDELLFSGADGKLVPLADGVAWMAKTKAHLMRATGDASQGSGFKGTQQGGNPAAKTMTRSEFDAASHVQRADFAKTGGQVVDA